jgi:hypothetical protein
MSDEQVCTACGHVGSSKTITKGHFALEVVLWLCFLLPGIIYSVWRHTSRYEACPVCGNPKLLPKAAPMAQKFLQENLPEKLVVKPEAVRLPSKAAHSAGRSLGRLMGKFFK